MSMYEHVLLSFLYLAIYLFILLFIVVDLILPYHFSIFPFTAEARTLEELRHGKSCCTGNDCCMGTYEVNIDVYKLYLFLVY